MSSRIRMGWALDWLDQPFTNADFKFWSGRNQLTITETDGSTTTYKPTMTENDASVISIKAPDETPGEAVRLQAIMDASDPNIRVQLRRDFGPLRLRLRWLYYNADDATPQWKLTSKSFTGRLSSPTLEGAMYTVDVESMISDVDRGRAVIWSHDNQLASNPGDKGFEYIASLAEGISTKWPP